MTASEFSPDKHYTAAEALWAEVQTTYSTRSTFVSLTTSWAGMMGLSPRLGSRRLTVMQSDKRARWLVSKLEGLSNASLAAFKTMAFINKDQAEAAFRYMAVVNFTVPLTLIVAANQIWKVDFGELIRQLSADGGLWIMVGLLAFAITTSYLYITAAHKAVGQARDIYHLALLELSKRQITSDAEDTEAVDMSTLPLDLS